MELEGEKARGGAELSEIEKAQERRDAIVERQRALLRRAEDFAARAEEKVRAHGAAREAGVAGDEAELKRAKQLLGEAEDCRTFATYHREEAAKLDEKIAECRREIETLRHRAAGDRCSIQFAEAEKKMQAASAKLAEFLALGKECEQLFDGVSEELTRIDRNWSEPKEIRNIGTRLFFIIAVRELEKAFPAEQQLGRLAAESRPLELEQKLRDLVRSACSRVSFRERAQSKK